MTATETLLPCPFCGGMAGLCEELGFYWVNCEECCASSPTTAEKKHAIEAWNNRLASAIAYRRTDEYGDVLRVVVRGRYPECIEAELDGNVLPFFRQQTCHPEEQYLDTHSDLTVTVCSECGVPTDDLEDCNYCPNCGRRVV